MKSANLILSSGCCRIGLRIVSHLVVLFFAVFFAASSFAQTGARISGVVTDKTGGLLVGVSVTLQDEASGTQLKTTTDSRGTYFFDPVLPRAYSLVAQMKGFSTYSHSGIQVHPSARLNFNITLEVGSIVELVQVTAEATNVVPVDSGAKMEVISARQIENLSTIGRNAMELLTILPGVVAGGASTGNAYNALGGSSFINNSINNFNVNGLRNDMNDIRSDGGTVLGPGNNGTFMLEPNMDMISEFSVKTSNFEADQGRGAMIVETVTKSGGNKFHGTLYWYHRDASLNANDWSNNQTGGKKPASLFNYPGFNIGGPVLIPGTKFNKDRNSTFFFFGSEWQRQKPDLGSTLAVVPTDAMRRGDFSELLNGPTCAASPHTYLHQPCQLKDPITGNPLNGNIIPESQISQTGLIQLSLYPQPNFSDPAHLWNYASRAIRPLNRNEQVIRLDHNFSDATRLYARMARNSEYAYYSYGETWSYPGERPSNVEWLTPIVGPSDTRSLSINLVHTFTPRLVNEFQFGTTSLSSFNRYEDPSVMSKSARGYEFNGIEAFNTQNDGIPMMLDFGGTPGTSRWSQYAGDFSAGMGSKFTNFEWNDNLTWAKGGHLFKFGFNANRTRVDQRNGNKVEGLLATGAWGTTTGNQFGDILTDHYKYYAQSSSDPLGMFRYTNIEGYAQDSWKVTPHLTLNYGLRISYLSPWVEKNGLAVTFDPSRYDSTQPDLALNGILLASNGDIPMGVVPNPKPVFQPRLGFAWDVFGSAKSVLRGGFGIYTLRDQGNTLMNYSFRNPPNVYTVELADWCCGGFSHADIEGVNPFGALGNLLISARDIHDDKVPQTYEYSLTWSQALPQKTIVELSYVGNTSRHLFGFHNLNAVPMGAMWLPGTQTPASTFSQPYRPYNPWGSILWAEHNLNANYNSLQAVVKRDVTHGLTLQGSYTFSKSLGDQGAAGDQSDAFFPEKGYGLLGYDRDQTLSVAYIYEIPSLAKRYLGGNPVLAGILDNWRMSGVTRYVAGPPISVGIGAVTCITSPGETNPATEVLCRTFVGGTTPGITWYGTSDEPLRAQMTQRPDIGKNFHKVNDSWVDADSFTLPAMGEFGSFRQPTFRAPAFNNWDWALTKSFPFGKEGRRIDFRWSMFNMFNRAQLAAPSMSADMAWVLNPGATSLAQGTGRITNTDKFGKILSKTGHREMEFALKVHF